MNDFKEYKAAFLEQNDLKHFGILGMRWGIRRYQNPDGSLTPAGQRRYNENMSFRNKVNMDRKYQKHRERMREEANKRWEEDIKRERDDEEDWEKDLHKAKLSKEEFTNIRNSFKTDIAKDLWEKAYDTDEFDLDFLERTDQEWSDKKVLEEYAKYLDKKWNKKENR